jgi:K+-sensing histidine kinase KdpD
MYISELLKLDVSAQKRINQFVLIEAKLPIAKHNEIKSGSLLEKRYQDVEVILAAGIDV